MEMFLTFLLILAIIVWCLILPIMAIIFINKYRNIKKRVSLTYQEGHLLDTDYFYLTGNEPTSAAKSRAKAARTKLIETPHNVTQSAPLSATPAKETVPENTEETPKSKQLITGLISIALPPAKSVPNEIFQLVSLAQPTLCGLTTNCLNSISLPKATESSFIQPETSQVNQTESTKHDDKSPNTNNITNAITTCEIKFSHSIQESTTCFEEAPNINKTALTELPETTIQPQISNLSVPAEASENSSSTRDVVETTTKPDNTYHLPIILAIGVILLCTAGAAWVASIWSSASNIVKLVSMASFSVIFFAAFGLAQRVLQIPNSARAFYILGVAGLGTATIGAEILGIVLSDCALSTQFLIPTAIMAFGMGIGYIIFRSPLFIALTGILSYTFITSLSAAIFSSGWMFSVIPAILALIAFIWYRISNPIIQTKSKVYIQGGLIVSFVLAAISGIAVDSAFDSITLLIINITTYIAVLEHTFRKYTSILNIELTAGLVYIIYLFHKCFEIPPSIVLASAYTLLIASFSLMQVCAKRSLLFAHNNNISNEEYKLIERTKLSADTLQLFVHISQIIAIGVASGIVLHETNSADIRPLQSFACLIPFFYFSIMGFRSSSLKNQLVNLISALILLAIPVCLTRHHHDFFGASSLFQLDVRNEWFYHLVFSLPILAFAVIPDVKFIGKRLTRQFFAIAAFIVLAIAANKTSELSYTTCLFCMPGLFFLFAGNRKPSNLPKFIFYSPALVFLPIACFNYIDIADSSSFSFNTTPWLNAIYVIFAISLAIIPDCNALGKRTHREHFATLLLLILSTITLYQHFDHTFFQHLTELIPVAGALALTIHECIWFNRHNSRYMTTISAAILYIISTAILFDIAKQFDNLTHYHINIPFMFPVIATLAIIPLCIEHYICSKSQYRHYHYLTIAGYYIPAIATICSFFSHDLVHPTATAIMLLATGLIGSWCVNHREHHRYGIILATSVYFGLYLLFSTFYIDDKLFGLPTYFNCIFTSLILAALAFYDGHKFKGYTPLRAIWAISAIPLLAVKHDSWHVAHTTGIVMIAANLLQYLTNGGHSDRDRCIITIAVSIMTIASVIRICVFDQTFAGITVDLRPILASLIPVAAAYLVSRFTWNFRSPSHVICFAIACLSTLILFFYPTHDILLYNIIITIAALASIAISVAYKYKRYLAYGCTFILMIFFSQTKSFWYDLHWWVYLAIVAATLIFFAVTNEILIRKGSSILKKIQASRINQWRW